MWIQALTVKNGSYYRDISFISRELVRAIFWYTGWLLCINAVIEAMHVLGGVAINIFPSVDKFTISDVDDSSPTSVTIQITNVVDALEKLEIPGSVEVITEIDSITNSVKVRIMCWCCGDVIAEYAWHVLGKQ